MKSSLITRNRRKEIPFREKKQCQRSNVDKSHLWKLILISVECNRLSSQHHRRKFQRTMSSFWCILNDVSLIYVMCKVHTTRSYHFLLLGMDSPIITLPSSLLSCFYQYVHIQVIICQFTVFVSCVWEVKKISLYVIKMDCKASQIAQTESWHIKSFPSTATIFKQHAVQEPD